MKHNRQTLLAIGLILLAMAILPLIDVVAKKLGQQGVPVPQMVWARFFFGAIFTLPFALHSDGGAALRPINPKLNTLRALCLILGTAFFFSALHYLPIATTLAIYFVQPLIITAFSPLILQEQVSTRRWGTVFVGFIGVLIIIRPGIQILNLGHIFAVCAGFCSAFYFLITRLLKGRASPIVTTFQTSAVGALGLTLAAPIYWLPASGIQWLSLIALGAVAIGGHYLVTKAYYFAEASLLSPLNYSEMITSVILGWLFFADFPDVLTFLGVAILIACATIVSRGAMPVNESGVVASKP